MYAHRCRRQYLQEVHNNRRLCLLPCSQDLRQREWFSEQSFAQMFQILSNLLARCAPPRLALPAALPHTPTAVHRPNLWVCLKPCQASADNDMNSLFC